MKVLQSFFGNILSLLFRQQVDRSKPATKTWGDPEYVGSVDLGDHFSISFWKFPSKEIAKEYVRWHRGQHQPTFLTSQQYVRLLDSSFIREQLMKINNLSSLYASGVLVAQGDLDFI